MLVSNARDGMGRVPLRVMSYAQRGSKTTSKIARSKARYIRRQNMPTLADALNSFELDELRDLSTGTTSIRLTHTLCRTRHHWERSEEHTSELQSLMRISYAVFCLKKQKTNSAI